MKSKTLGIVGLIVVLIFAIIWFNRSSPLSVEVYPVDFGSVESTIANTRSGTIEACKRSRLAPSIGGQIAAIYAQEGQKVKTGELLMELWNHDRQAALAQSQAALKVHQLNQHGICISAARDDREAGRMAELARKELAAEDILDRATSKAHASEATCLAAKSQEKEFQARTEFMLAQLEQTQIRAPFDGVVAKITGEIGEYMTPSPPGVPTPPAIDLLTDDCFYLSAPIDEVDAAQLKLGQTARVTLDAFRGQSFSGSLKRIAPYVEDIAKQARTVTIEVNFDPAERTLLAGYSADVEIILASKASVLRVPSETIMEDNYVWVVDTNHQLQKVEVRPGVGNWKFTEIIDGLDPGQFVVTSLGLSGLEQGIEVVAIQSVKNP